jgi:hypothetical protein
MVEKMVLVGSGGFGRRVSWLLRLLSVPVLGDLMYQPWLNRKMGVTSVYSIGRPTSWRNFCRRWTG